MSVLLPLENWPGWPPPGPASPPVSLLGRRVSFGHQIGWALADDRPVYSEWRGVKSDGVLWSPQLGACLPTAWLLLGWASGERLATRWSRPFADQVVTRMPDSGWCLDSVDVLGWLRVMESTGKGGRTWQ